MSRDGQKLYQSTGLTVVKKLGTRKLFVLHWLFWCLLLFASMYFILIFISCFLLNHFMRFYVLFGQFKKIVNTWLILPALNVVHILHIVFIMYTSWVTCVPVYTLRSTLCSMHYITQRMCIVYNKHFSATFTRTLRTSKKKWRWVHQIRRHTSLSRTIDSYQFQTE